MYLVKVVLMDEVRLAHIGATAYTWFKNPFVDYETFDVPSKAYIGNSDDIMPYGTKC